MSQTDLRTFAKAVNGNIPLEVIKCIRENAFPASRLPEVMSLDEWNRWFGDEGRRDCLPMEDIEEPIILIDHDGIKVWDGCHRSSASALKAADTFRVVHGTDPEPIMEIRPR